MESNINNTALLVMDMQSAILSNFPEAAPLINKVARAITVARDKKIPVLYIRVGFRTEAPEISERNKSFSESKTRYTSAKAAEFLKIEPALAPLEQEIVITKRRISAFTGSDLEVVLRALGIQHIILTGVSTSGVVLSTVREAADKDYQITVLSDCCADRDEEVHHVLTTKVFPRQAAVLTIQEWAEIS